TTSSNHLKLIRFVIHYHFHPKLNTELRYQVIRDSHPTLLHQAFDDNIIVMRQAFAFHQGFGDQASAGGQQLALLQIHRILQKWSNGNGLKKEWADRAVARDCNYMRAPGSENRLFIDRTSVV